MHGTYIKKIGITHRKFHLIKFLV